MSRVYGDFNTENFKSQELVGLVHRVEELTQYGYEALNKHFNLFENIYKKVLQLSKQEKEWHLYFDTIYQLIALYIRHGKNDEVVKCAELFYKESDLHMDRELPNYPGTDMSYTNTWTYGRIFEAYYRYHQIDDAKMDSFMRKYEESALKYGKTYLYYRDEIHLSVLYRDAARAEIAAGNFRYYEKEMESCYVCGHKAYLSYLLLTGQDDMAEEMMLNLIHKNIPKQHQWCYKYCEEAVPDAMYAYTMWQCVEGGREELFRHYYEKYWKSLPHESRWEPDVWTFRRLLCALMGDFKELKDDIREAEKDIKENEKHETTVGNMNLALQWWCYFTLLDRSGVHEARISLPGLDASDTLSVASYMEKRADGFGELFSKARAKFDYEGLKDTYKNCFLSE